MGTYPCGLVVTEHSADSAKMAVWVGKLNNNGTVNHAIYAQNLCDITDLFTHAHVHCR